MLLLLLKPLDSRPPCISSIFHRCLDQSQWKLVGVTGRSRNHLALKKTETGDLRCSTGGALTIAVWKKLGRNHMKSLPSPQQRSPLDPSWYGPSSPCSPFRWAWWHIKSEVGSPIIEITLKLVFLHSFPANSAWSMLWSVGPWQLQLVVESWKFKLGSLDGSGWISPCGTKNDASHLSRNCNLEGNHPAPTHGHRVFHAFSPPLTPPDNRQESIAWQYQSASRALDQPTQQRRRCLLQSCTMFHPTTNGPAKCQGREVILDKNHRITFQKQNVREPILGGCGLTVNPFPVSLRATAFDVYYRFTLAACSPCIPLLSQGVTAARSRVISHFRTYYISTSFLQVPGTQTTQMLVRHKIPCIQNKQLDISGDGNMLTASHPSTLLGF